MKSRWLLCNCMIALCTPGAVFAQTQTGSAGPHPASTPSSSGQDGNDKGAGAQDSQVKDIVVTAQRRSERLQDVPVAVSAATAERLDAVGITTTQDLSLITPGLSAPQAAGFTQPHIRGIGSSSNGPGLEQPVATYIDGVYVAAAPASLLTLNNVDRIEVLKGPQGTLFGRNATGGLIQIVSKDPQHTPSGELGLTYGNYEDVVAEAYLTSGITTNLAADIAVRYEHQNEGWGSNLTTGNKTANLPHDFAVRSKWLLEPSDQTQIRLALDYESRRDRRNSQHLGRQYPGTFNSPFFGGPFPQGDAYDINRDIDPEDQLTSGGASLQVDHDFGGVHLQSITAYRQSKFDFLIDIDLTPRPFASIGATAKAKQFSQELQLSSDTVERLKWVAGLYYFYADDQYDPLVIRFGPTVVSPVPNVPTALQWNTRQRTDSVAGYAQATYEVLDNTNVTLGARYTYEKKRADGSMSFAIADHTVSTVPFPDAGIPDSISFKKFTYRVALDHKFGPNLMAYASYNTGFKSGGYNLSLGANAPYKPEEIGAAEIGLKSELFGRRLRLNIAAYDYRYKNIQVGRYINNNLALYNGAKAHIYGLDLDGELVVTQGLTLSGGFAYTHARFTSFPEADFIVPVGGCTPIPGGVCPGSAEGKRLPYSPTTTFNIGGDYKVDLPFGSFTLNATYFRTSRFYSNPDNVLLQPAYDLINASLTWRDPSEALSVKLWGKNLGDTVYATSLVEANQGAVYQVGAPRTYGVTLGYKF